MRNVTQRPGRAFAANIRWVSVAAVAGLSVLTCPFSAPTRSDPVTEQTSAQHHPANPNRSTPMGIPLAPPPSAWLTRHWTGNSAPFDTAVRELRAQARNGGDTAAADERIYEHEKAAAQEAPLVLMAQFRWLFAAMEVAYSSHVMDYHAQDAVARLDPGVFRTIARTRYAAEVETEVSKPHPELTSLAERLMASDTADLWVRDTAIRDLANGRATLSLAVTLGDRWVREAPNSAQAHGVRAYVAQNQWLWSGKKDRAAAERTVAEYEAFLRLSPQGDPSRHAARYMARAVRKMAGLTGTGIAP